MITLVGFSGSLRKASYNSAVLRAAAELMPPDSELEIETIAGIPLYNGDDEAEHGVPEAVTRLKNAIAAADALLIVTPEYNNSLPGVTKNAVDWLSRPSTDVPRVFGGRPVAIMGASPGRLGTVLAQNAWLPVFRTLGAELWTGGRLLISQAGSLVNESGMLVHAETREKIENFLAGFVAYVRARGASESAVSSTDEPRFLQARTPYSRQRPRDLG